MTRKAAIEAARDAVQEIHFDSYGLIPEIVDAAISAYEAALVPEDVAGLIERLHEAADRVARRAMGKDARALVSIPRSPEDVDAIICEAAAALTRLSTALQPAADLAAELAAVKAGNMELLRHLSAEAQARGLAEGKLAASEMAGVVRGWQERAETAEAEADRLRTELAEAESAVWRVFPNTHTVPSDHSSGSTTPDPFEGPGETYKGAYNRLCKLETSWENTRLALANSQNDLGTMRLERDHLRKLLDEAREVIEPFANIEPSTAVAHDGSEAEPYCVYLACRDRFDFTGADLAAARAFLKKLGGQDA